MTHIKDLLTQKLRRLIKNTLFNNIFNTKRKKNTKDGNHKDIFKMEFFLSNSGRMIRNMFG